MADIRMTLAWILAAIAVALNPIASGAEVRLLPTSARLDGPHARQRFLVERIEASVGTADLTPRAVFATDNPRVVTVDANGYVTPIHDGLATISATVDGQVARASISVENHDRDEPWSFPQPRRGDPDQAGLQLGCVPRRGRRQERLSTDLARLRSRARLTPS